MTADSQNQDTSDQNNILPEQNSGGTAAQDDVLELTQMVQEDGSVVNLKEETFTEEDADTGSRADESVDGMANLEVPSQTGQEMATEMTASNEAVVEVAEDRSEDNASGPEVSAETVQEGAVDSKAADESVVASEQEVVDPSEPEESAETGPEETAAMNVEVSDSPEDCVAEHDTATELAQKESIETTSDQSVEEDVSGGEATAKAESEEVAEMNASEGKIDEAVMEAAQQASETGQEGTAENATENTVLENIASEGALDQSQSIKEDVSEVKVVPETEQEEITRVSASEGMIAEAAAEFAESNASELEEVTDIKQETAIEASASDDVVSASIPPVENNSAALFSAHRPTENIDAGLISQEAFAQSTQSIASLLQTTAERQKVDSQMTQSVGNQTVEGLMREMLRPMLKDWLDAHLPSLVKWIVTEQIEKMMKESSQDGSQQNSDKKSA